MKSEPNSATALPGNRSFGLLFVSVFGLLGLWSYWRNGQFYPWWFAASGMVGILTLLAPSVLTPFTQAWMRLAYLLHRVVSPLVLALLFFGVIAPFGILKRLTGWDPMRRRFEPDIPSYWVDREPPRLESESFKNQY